MSKIKPDDDRECRGQSRGEGTPRLGVGKALYDMALKLKSERDKELGRPRATSAPEPLTHS